jgi:hypothetical protein
MISASVAPLPRLNIAISWFGFLARFAHSFGLHCVGRRFAVLAIDSVWLLSFSLRHFAVVTVITPIGQTSREFCWRFGR